METPKMGSEAPNPGPEGKEKINLRILIAEDDPIIGSLLLLILRAKYSSVELVTTGQKLVDKMEDSGSNFDFIITDNTMPDLHGIDAIEKIRTLEHGKNIPIILHTTDSDRDLKPRAEELGATFLPKPARPAELVTAIEEKRKK